jgi:hypothetical protein
MTVDRGGIDYPITVTANGFNNLNTFKKSLAEIKKEMKDVQKLQAGGTGRAASGTAAKRAETNQKKLTDLQKERLKIQKQQALLNSRTLQTQKTRLARQRQIVNAERQLALLKNPALNKLKRELAVERSIQAVKVQRAKLENNALRTATRQLTIDKQIAAFQEKQAKFAALAAFARQKGLTGNAQALSDLGISRARAQGLGLLDKEAPKQLDKTSARASALSKTMKGLGSIVNRVQASFVRLFTALAFFAVARRVIEIFKNLIASMVTFNAQLEQAKLGIASLLLATGFVVSAQGEIVEGAEALAAAQKIAVAQTTLLRKEALKTAATFDDLVQAYQTAIAPGVGAGLSVDQVREFTVRISQAATAIGLPQNQLAEEIRSILQGTIQARTTRIATSLGISNEDIANAKEAGRLFEFLTEKFGAFKVAGEEALNTFGALFTNLKDALLLVAGQAGLGFFESIKALLKDLRDELVVIDKLTGAIFPTEEALAAFQTLGDTLKGIAADFREVLLGNDLGVLTSAVNLLSKGLELVAGILLGILETVQLIGTALAPITFLLNLFNISSKDLGRFLGQLVVVGIALKAVPWTLIIAAVTKLGAGSFLAGLGQIAGFLPLFLSLAIALAAVGVAMKVISDRVKDIQKELGDEATWQDAVEVAFITLKGMFDKVWESVKSFISSIPLRFKQAFLLVKSTALEVIQALVVLATDSIVKVFDELVKKFPKLASLLGIQEGDVSGTIKVVTDQLRKASTEAGKAVKAVDAELVKVGKTLDANLDKIEQNTLAQIALVKAGRGEEPEGLGTGAGRARALQTFIGGATGAVAGRPTLDFDSLTKNFTKSLEKASRELDLAKLNLPQQSLQVRRIELEESLKVLEAQKQVQQEINSLEQASINRQKRLTAEREKLSKSQRKLVDDLVATGGDPKAADRILKASAATDRQEQEAAKIAADIIQSRNQEIADQARKNALLETQQQLELDSSNLLNTRLLKLKTELDLKNEIARKEAEITAARTRLQTQRDAGGVSREDFEVQSLQLEARAANIRVAELERLKNASLLTSEQQRLNAELQVELAALDAINVKLRESQVIAEEGTEAVIMGLSDGWNQFIDGLPNRYEIALNGIKDILGQVASVISDTLTRALDPSQGDVKDRWQKFFRDISNIILRTTIKSLLTSLAKSQSGNIIGSLLKTFSSGFAHGGAVQGFAEGGTVASHPPAVNKDPRDTVPAWLRPGEYVVRPEVVRKLGVGFFEGINNGLINPFLGLDGMQGLKGASSRRARTSSMSFATGGSVPAGGAGGAGPAVLPVMLANEDTMEQLIANGEAAFRKGIQNNQDAIAISGPRADRGGRS